MYSSHLRYAYCKNDRINRIIHTLVMHKHANTTQHAHSRSLALSIYDTYVHTCIVLTNVLEFFALLLLLGVFLFDLLRVDDDDGFVFFVFLVCLL